MIIRHAQPVHVTQYDPNGNGSDKDAGQQRTVTDGNTLHVTEYCWESGADSMEASGLRAYVLGASGFERAPPEGGYRPRASNLHSMPLLSKAVEWR